MPATSTHITTAANTIIRVDAYPGSEGQVIIATITATDLPAYLSTMVLEHLRNGIDVTDSGYQAGLYAAMRVAISPERDVFSLSFDDANQPELIANLVAHPAQPLDDLDQDQRD